MTGTTGRRTWGCVCATSIVRCGSSVTGWASRRPSASSSTAARPGPRASLEVPGPVRIVSQFIQNDTMKIELLALRRARRRSGRRRPPRNQLGLTHLSFYVDDLDQAATRHLVDCGATVHRGDPRQPRHRPPVPRRPRRCARRAHGPPGVTVVPDVELTVDDERFRRDVAAWLADHVVGEYAELQGRGGPGDEDVGFDVRVALGARARTRPGSSGSGGRSKFGGRGATLAQQMIWAEEYTRAEAPARVNHMGENLLAPTLIALRHAGAAGALPARHPAR